MSLYEAELILHRYKHCSEGQRYKIFRHLKREYYIDFTTDNKYILPGFLKDNRGDNKLSKATVIALYVALEQFAKDKESFETVLYTYKSQGGAIGFMSAGRLYKAYMLSFDNIYKIRIIEEKYLKKKSKLDDDRMAKGMKYDEVSIFMFAEHTRSDKILEAIENMELTMPHRIIITHSTDCTGAISYDQYDCIE